jgi:hypothetical protein
MWLQADLTERHLSALIRTLDVFNSDQTKIEELNKVGVPIVILALNKPMLNGKITVVFSPDTFSILGKIEPTINIFTVFTTNEVIDISNIEEWTKVFGSDSLFENLAKKSKAHVYMEDVNASHKTAHHYTP